MEDDELYMVWSKLKAVTISECEEQEVGDSKTVLAFTFTGHLN